MRAQRARLRGKNFQKSPVGAFLKGGAFSHGLRRLCYDVPIDRRGRHGQPNHRPPQTRQKRSATMTRIEAMTACRSSSVAFPRSRRGRSSRMLVFTGPRPSNAGSVGSPKRQSARPMTCPANWQRCICTNSFFSAGFTLPIVFLLLLHINISSFHFRFSLQYLDFLMSNSKK